MALIYRAVWDDEWAEPLNMLEDEFKTWCASKGVESEDVPYRGRLDESDRLWIDVRRADAEVGRALRCTLSERDLRGRTWTTTATALAHGDSRTFWVDLELDDPSGAPADLAAPRLVRSLLDQSERARTDGRRIRAVAVRTNPGNVDDLLELLLDPNRQLPVVVFSTDIRADASTNLKRADNAAQTLAGIAHVYSLSPKANEALNEALPDGFRIYSGAVRTYLPGLQIGDPDDAPRHRWVPVRLIADHPRKAASVLAARFVRLQVHPPIPPAWGELGALLRRPTESEVEARINQIMTSRSAGSAEVTIEVLRGEVEELTKLLAVSDLMLESNARDAGREIDRLSDALARTESEAIDDADELEELRNERDALQRTVRVMAASQRGDDCQPAELDELPTPMTIDDAIVQATLYLPFVAIHNGAPVDTDELEATAKSRVWASAIWQGLRALNDYAAEKRSGGRASGFRKWCDETSEWPVNKLAMTESESVMNNEHLRNQRLFPVSIDVDLSGRIHMYAHLKIQVGGGDNIPRLYFYDDTDGSTGLMHVGFIGPHRLVRNTKS